ncbi:hypothetical protein VD0002_g6043 [Verticillium dahliae]|uniref:Uncharacterized protein n=1 Tax=Verticillium dahliae TaxID=27337 RepID=A0AA44WQB3_VERDA|nr:hypothetical protein BJF96_g2877 [Verticillium dahliae]PNH51696.1 hypothetical protein VD0003_g5555 [Verticillium dahliae]PNH61862.1 hypothetical protein VD0002_g6043 [Verticillium dahliae]
MSLVFLSPSRFLLFVAAGYLATGGGANNNQTAMIRAPRMVDGSVTIIH